MNSPYESANFLQSKDWAKMNKLIGHKVYTHPCLMIVKDAKRGRYLEVPGGPLINWHSRVLTEKVFKGIKAVAEKEECVFIRVRPQLLDTKENRELFASLGFRIAPMHLHAEHTVIIDLAQDEETLLANMRRQTRYEVRRSIKQGIIVEKSCSEEVFKEFHQIQADTAARQHFVPPSERELLAEHEAFGENAVIYIAKTAEDKKPIAYGLILKSGDEADYFEAASTELNRKLPGAYALQWQVMRDLKSEGFKRYNLWGIAPPNQPNHRYAKVTTFKTGFGGEIVTYLPAHDLVLSPKKYKLNLLVETIRKKKRHLS